MLLLSKTAVGVSRHCLYTEWILIGWQKIPAVSSVVAGGVARSY